MPTPVDPEEVYRVISLFDDFPVSGDQAARQASANGASQETVEFFEALERIDDNGGVVALAEEQSQYKDPPNFEIKFPG